MVTVALLFACCFIFESLAKLNFILLTYRPNTDAASVAAPTSPVPKISRKNFEDDDYQPFANRDMSKAISNATATMHILKSAIGAGILAMPKAFWGTGIVLGSVTTLFCGFYCIACQNSLVVVAHEQARRSKVPALNYGQVARHTCANATHPTIKKMSTIAELVVNISLVITYLGISAVYAVFVGTQTKQLFECTGSPSEGEAQRSVVLYIVIYTIIYVVLSQFRSLAIMSPLSIFGNVTYLISFAIIFYYIFKDAFLPFSELNIASFSKMPLALVVIWFSIENIGMILPIENQMKNPEQFPGWTGVLAKSMGGVTLVYAVMGFLPYMKWGSEIEDLITLNLKTGEVLATTAQVMVVLSIIASYCLNMYVPLNITIGYIKELIYGKVTKPITRTIIFTGIRAAFALATVVLAILVPKLSAIIGIVSSVLLLFLGLFIPAVLEMITFWTKGRYQLMRIKCSLFILGSFVIAVIGLYHSVLEFQKRAD